jgi:hypothetical protein
MCKRPSDCGELDKTTCKSGVYKIYPNNTSGFEVYCEMEKNGGGWTVSDAMLFRQHWTQNTKRRKTKEEEKNVI